MNNRGDDVLGDRVEQPSANDAIIPVPHHLLLRIAINRIRERTVDIPVLVFPFESETHRSEPRVVVVAG